MKISVKSLVGNRGASLDFRETFSLSDISLLESMGVVSASSVTVCGNVKSYGSSLMIHCFIEIELVKRCDRCLCEYDEMVEIEAEHRITKDEEDINVIVLEDNEIDLEDLIVDELLIQLPTQSLCDEDCMGLCPECGVDLNFVECDCGKNKVDARMAVLLDLLNE